GARLAGAPLHRGRLRPGRRSAVGWQAAGTRRRVSLRKEVYLARDRYAPESVSTRITAPVSMKFGTGTMSPVSVVAGFSTLVTVAVFMPGATSVTLRSTVFGSSTPMGLPS